MRIRNNISALNASRFLGMATKNMDKTIEKLSSGNRINSAADDAAGLSISEKMRAEIRGLNQAYRNAQDGISLIQTAEGALGEIHSMLQRIHELSTQAANDPNTSADRKSIQKEISELLKEIDSTAVKTEFNKIKLLDGSLAKDISPIANEKNNMTLQELLSKDNKNLNIIYMNDVDDFETTQSASGNTTLSGNTYLKDMLQKQIVPQAVTSVLNAFSPAFNYLSSSSIGIGLKLYSDSSSTTLAAVSAGVYSSGGNNVDSTMLSYQLSVNMASLSYDSNGQLTQQSRNALETTVVHEMVHAFMDEAVTNGMIGITDGVYDTRYSGSEANYQKSPNSYPSWFKEGMAQTAAGGYANCNDWVNGGMGITTSASQGSIAGIVTNSNNSLSSGTTASKYGTGYLACMYIGYLASGSSSVTATSISNGLGKVLSELAGGKSLDAVINERTSGKYTSVSDFESKFGDADSTAFIYKLTQIVGNTGNGGLATGNLTDSDLLPDANKTTSLFSLNTQNDEITNIYPSGVNVLSGGGRSSSGTSPVPDYSSTINGDPNPPVSPGSTIDLSNISTISGVNYDSVNKILTITDSGDYTLTGANVNGVRVLVNSGVKANITLINASINTTNGSGIDLDGTASVTLNLVGNNSVITSFNGSAGIRVTTGATLVVQGNGSLIAKSQYISGQDVGSGAGIGGGSHEDGGTIIINGGTITAEGQLDAAGIGGGDVGNGGNITITGGIVNATSIDGAGIGGGDCVNVGDPEVTGGNITITGGNITSISKNHGAGIGGGNAGNGGIINISGGNIFAEAELFGAGIGGGASASGGNITIKGGTITANGGKCSAGIGGGIYENGGNIVIDGSGVLVKATGGLGAANIGGGCSSDSGGNIVSGGTTTKTQGIVFDGSSGEVYGDITLNSPLDCDGKTLTVKSGSTLTVLGGGRITNHGTFTNNGRIENHGIIGSVSGTGVTHHYVTGISKSIIEPTTATIGKSLADSISKLTPSKITVAYNGTTRTLTGTWSVKDKNGNEISDLTGTIVGDNDNFTYTVTFASEDGIYFDPSNMSIYEMKAFNSAHLNEQVVSDSYVSALAPNSEGNKLSYSYVVAAAPASADPVVPPNPPNDTPDDNQIGGLTIQVGSQAGQTIGITIESVHTSALGINNLSVLTHDDAENAIDTSYEAIQKVTNIRSNLGAFQNRLEHTVNNINNMSENLQSAESRIRDLDMAKAIMQYSKLNILMQVDQAMLAQANQTSNSVLKLLS